MVIAMWPSLARARRLASRSSTTDLLPATAEAAEAEARAEADAALTPHVDTDLVVSLGRPDVDRLAGALQVLLGPGLTRPDTPARLEAALASAVERLGGDGRPRVVRQPAGITAPEAWQIRLTGVDPAIADAIRGATRGRPLAVAS
jgi:hypothetical protein